MKTSITTTATVLLVIAVVAGCTGDTDESGPDRVTTTDAGASTSVAPSSDAALDTPSNTWFDVLGDDVRESPPATSDGLADGLETDARPDDGDSRALALAPAAAGNFVPITPYRAIDSRSLGGDGLMYPGREVYFDATSDATGVQRIPPTATAVTYNLTVTATTGVGGFIALYPAGQPWPGNSSINWFAGGIDLANGGVVALGNRTGPGQVSFYAGPVLGTSAYVILDITGYFA